MFLCQETAQGKVRRTVVIVVEAYVTGHQPR